MEITVETIPASPIAYIRRVGAYGAGNAQTMAQIKQWAATKRLMDEKAVIFGIAQNDPRRTAPENCRYDACIVLADRDFPIDKNVEYGEIAGGSYAVFLIAHTAEAMGQAWSDIFYTLSGMRVAVDSTRPILERYASEKVVQHLCEICVPIET